MIVNGALFGDSCCGCGVCAEKCVNKAIQMVPNNQGFFYPKIIVEKCINCGICVDACAFNHVHLEHVSLQQSFAVKNRDANIRAKSRSGGVFTAISDFILAHNGVVYGCKMIDCRTAVHSRATSKEERDAFLGSKYIPSILFSVYPQIREDLKLGRYVLFSGTACQVNAIKHFCEDLDCSKLILADIVCHGVPSPVVWSDYLDFLEAKFHDKIVSVNFRDKARFGWAAHFETVLFEGGKVYSSHTFRDLFYNHLALRRSCFHCPFKCRDRVGDFTLADCWGIATNLPDFDDDKGVSLLFVNSVNGSVIFRAIQDQLDCVPVDPKDFPQPPLRQNWPVPDEYEKFWSSYHHHSFSWMLHVYVYNIRYYKKKMNQFCRRFIRKIRSFMRR